MKLLKDKKKYAPRIPGSHGRDREYLYLQTVSVSKGGGGSYTISLRVQMRRANRTNPMSGRINAQKPSCV